MTGIGGLECVWSMKPKGALPAVIAKHEAAMNRDWKSSERGRSRERDGSLRCFLSDPCFVLGDDCAVILRAL